MKHTKHTKHTKHSLDVAALLDDSAPPFALLRRRTPAWTTTPSRC